MKLVNSPEAAWLAGLSQDRLREWRRQGYVEPAVVRLGQGSHAKYAWQGVLMLRVAVILRDRFRLELGALGYQFFELATVLRETEFISLWGKCLALEGGEHWSVMEGLQPHFAGEESLVIRLDCHLHVLSKAFCLPAHPRRLVG
jgi:hypothetical protein